MNLSSISRHLASGVLVSLAVAVTACGHGAMSLPEKVTLVGTVTVPLESVEGRLVVSASVDGRGPFLFIVDSGAAASLFALDFVRELALAGGGEMQIGSPGSSAKKTATLHRVRRLEIGGLAVENFTVLGLDLAELQKKVPGLKGVLSVQLFQGLLVKFDHPARRLEFSRGELPAANDRTIFSWSRFERLPSVVMNIGGRDVRVDLDTGSQGPITVEEKVAHGLEWLEPPVEGNPIKLVDTQYAAWRGRLKGNVTFGAFTLENPKLTYHKGPFNNVGYEVLKDFVFTIDSSNRRFELTRN